MKPLNRREILDRERRERAIRVISVGKGAAEGWRHPSSFGSLRSIWEGKFTDEEFADFFAKLSRGETVVTERCILSRDRAKEAELNGHAAPPTADFVDVELPDEVVRHASGPWRVGESLNGGPRVETVTGKHVASINTNHRSPWKPEVRLANARLLAAAPELLELVELGLGDCEDWEELARALIAKVRGEAP